MHTVSASLTFLLRLSESKKDKRMVRNSLVDKTRRKFNVAIAEVDNLESVKLLTIGIAVVSGSRSRAMQSLDSIIRYLDMNEEAELTDIAIE